MKKITRRSFLTACAAVAGTAALTACGGSGDSSATAASSGKPTKMFDTTSFSLSSGQMSWYFITSYQLILTGSDTYELNYNLNIFGAEDGTARGSRHIISAANTPPPLLRMVKSLMSITASSKLLLTQEGKRWTRSWGNCAFDTDN
ncbi:MAG: twin-arginine translocation signal domain-containing protein [Butyricicoccus sp.]